MEKIEKMRALAMAGELRGGQSHTVEIVVFIVFAAIIGAFVLNPNNGAVTVLQNIWTQAVTGIQNMVPAP